MANFDWLQLDMKFSRGNSLVFSLVVHSSFIHCSLLVKTFCTCDFDVANNNSNNNWIQCNLVLCSCSQKPINRLPNFVVFAIVRICFWTQTELSSTTARQRWLRCLRLFWWHHFVDTTSMLWCCLGNVLHCCADTTVLYVMALDAFTWQLAYIQCACGNGNVNVYVV